MRCSTYSAGDREKFGGIWLSIYQCLCYRASCCSVLVELLVEKLHDSLKEINLEGASGSWLFCRARPVMTARLNFTYRDIFFVGYLRVGAVNKKLSSHTAVTSGTVAPQRWL